MIHFMFCYFYIILYFYIISNMIEKIKSNIWLEMNEEWINLKQIHISYISYIYHDKIFVRNSTGFYM